MPSLKHPQWHYFLCCSLVFVMLYAFDAWKQVYVDAFMSLNNAHHLFRAKQVHMDGSRTCKQSEKWWYRLDLLPLRDPLPLPLSLTLGVYESKIKMWRMLIDLFLPREVEFHLGRWCFQSVEFFNEVTFYKHLYITSCELVCEMSRGVKITVPKLR